MNKTKIELSQTREKTKIVNGTLWQKNKVFYIYLHKHTTNNELELIIRGLRNDKYNKMKI